MMYLLVVNGVIGCNAKPCNDSHYSKIIIGMKITNSKV